ncbi:TetR/AcrR family transcriptional regulator [Actinomadura rugatobispora]|uniref:TetR/AcrR family transcriptional regulator n=1 Tax=Actinomadura rugatobispora TaxID=1994 RepID=A0ABW0ZXU5_9ACTN
MSRRAGAARERVLAVALKLFARHGVAGTSLQMIADELGVTKAAVYHQFQSKEDIVWAVIAPALDELTRVAEAAEARKRRSDQLGAVLSGVVDLVVSHRRLTAVIRTDPTISALMRERPALRALEARIDRVITGPDPDTETVVSAAMVSSALLAVGMDPRLDGLDDETLRRHLLGIARRLLRLRPLPRSRPGGVPGRDAHPA